MPAGAEHSSVSIGSTNNCGPSTKVTCAVNAEWNVPTKAPTTQQQNTGSNGETSGQSRAEASQPTSSSRPRACCFCWCCCCSCSCLTVKGEEGQPKDPCNIELLEEEIPSLEEIKSWSKSFDRLMENKVGQNMFASFLKSEFSDENILFWQACEDLKNETNLDKVQEKARLIYEDFISILSPKEVSIDSRVREIVNNNMLQTTRGTFDEAQLQVYTLMHRDSYPRFINSSDYKQYLRKIAEQSGLEAALSESEELSAAPS